LTGKKMSVGMSKKKRPTTRKEGSKTQRPELTQHGEELKKHPLLLAEHAPIFRKREHKPGRKRPREECLQKNGGPVVF